ncbi:hypothetical protein ACTFIY_001051 [Dictyostelium cf. discoideum]
MENKANKKLKIIMIGDYYSGKTAIYNEFAGRKFGSYTCPSTFDLFYKEIMVDDEIVGYHFWDTADTERFTNLNRSYYRDANCCILCFDIHFEESFKNLDKWIKELHSKCLENGLESVKLSPPFVLIGTKSDIPRTDKSISKERIEQWCKNIEDQGIIDKVHYFETSAKNSKNITDLLNIISKFALNYFNSMQKLNESKLNITLEKSNNNNIKSSNC